VTVREGCTSSAWASTPVTGSTQTHCGRRSRRWLAGDLTERLEGAEPGAEVIGRFAVVLKEIADLHIGETVLVVSHGGPTMKTLRLGNP